MTGPEPSPAEPVAAEPVTGESAAVAPNPLLGIWRRPRETIRRLVDGRSRWHVFVLAGLSGIGMALDRMSTRNAGDEFSLGVILAACLVVGPLVGVAMLYLSGALLHLVGRSGGRSATGDELRVVSAWANVPTVAGLLLWVPMFAMLGPEIFSGEMPTVERGGLASGALIAIGVVQVALVLWSTVIFSHGVAEVQMLDSAWWGFAHVLAAWAIILIPALVVISVLRLAS